MAYDDSGYPKTLEEILMQELERRAIRPAPVFFPRRIEGGNHEYLHHFIKGNRRHANLTEHGSTALISHSTGRSMHINSASGSVVGTKRSDVLRGNEMLALWAEILPVFSPQLGFVLIK